MTFSKSNINFLSISTALLLWATLSSFAWSDHNGGGNSDDVNQAKLSKYKQKKYRKDATRLALRLVSKNNDFKSINANAPEQMVESIYSSLVAVHQSEHTMAKKVTQKHKLHTFPIPSVDRFFVVYKREAVWAKPLRLGDTTTDSEEINSLLEKYGLVIDKHVDWDEDHNSFNVRANKSLNLAPVAGDFSKIDGIVLVDLLMPSGDGNDIEIQKIDNGWEFNYMIKFDSCITGCQKKHVWTFKVLNNENVEFVGESGDDLPEWMSE